MDFELIDSCVKESCAIYSGARVKSSKLEHRVSVGNFSRVDFSSLSEFCRIDRNNHLYHVQMGKHSYTGMNTVLMHVEIGSFCSVSWNVSIGGADHDYRRVAQHSFLYNSHDRLRPNDENPAYDRFERQLKIGNDVWIAAGAVVTRDVQIGNGAVIGANAVVTKSIPPFAIAVGNPAKVIGYRFSEDIISALERLKWWDWSAEKIRHNYETLSSPPSLDALENLFSE